MNGRIKEKIEEVEDYLDELAELRPGTFEEYLKDFKTKAACERYFEKIVEAAVDLAFLVIREHGLRMPEEDKEAFDVLSDANVIEPELAKRLKEAKGMRNVIAHQYGHVGDKLVFMAVTTEIERDIAEFIRKIKKFGKPPK